MTVLVRPPQAGWPAVGGPGARERDQLGRIPQDLWEAPAEDDEAPARYYGKVYWRGPGDARTSSARCRRAVTGDSGRAPAGQWRTGRGAWSFRRTSMVTCSAGEYPGDRKSTRLNSSHLGISY